MTSERTYVLGGSELFREWGYVAMSRGRLENRLYVVAPAARERDEIAPSDPERSPTSSLTRALSQSRAQTAASDAALASSLASTPTAELVRQREELSREERATANLARQLHAVRAQRERAQRILDQHRTTPTPKREPRSSREQDVRGAAIAAQAADRVRSLADREDALHAELERADATTHAPSDQTRLSLIENELNSRRARTVRALDIEPAAYLVAELGPVPDHLADRKVWQRAARRLVTYRENFDVRDPHRAPRLRAPRAAPTRRAAHRPARPRRSTRSTQQAARAPRTQPRTRALARLKVPARQARRSHPPPRPHRSTRS